MTITTTAGANTASAGRRSLPPLPAGEIVGWFEPGSDEWHAARARGIGGSEIAAVVGLSPFESRFSLWHRKKGLLGPVEETEEMYWGKEHEPAICRRFARDHPELDVTPAPTYRHPDRPWQIANPDRHAGPDLFEAKTSRDDTGWGKPGTAEVPIHYRCQCVQYMDVTGSRRCWLGVLIAGSEYREYVIDYDPDEAEFLRDAGAAFMASLAAGERPDIDGHAATYRAIRELPDGLDDIDVEIPAALRERFHAAQDAAWAAEDELTACKGLLLDEIGTGRRAVCQDARVATRTVRNGRTFQLLPARTRRNAA